ncbi:hypothetical protein WL10_24275 [Burkholderia ubonensis]|uniref:hypothetical protein n=1 Tax=Burkholderia ubonensis TaxID=101571 RepID=UPI0007609B1A|nr:hypothetical protein [Burkholderia ubonensis]KVX85402.1 hypothetical protein WL10_24275 [Burkholderia ubonensis]
MKRLVVIVSILLLAVSAGQLTYLYAARGSDPSPWLNRAAPGNAPPAHDLSIGIAQTVDLSADAVAMQDLTARERDDQFRDWLLFAAVSAKGLPAERYSQIFFDLPPVRRGYTRSLGNFEYGSTRSRAIDKTTVVALVPAGRSAVQRKDDLAHIADLQRKNLGEPFERLEVVEYTLDGPHGKAQLQRVSDVTYAELFSPDYGYVEKPLSNLVDLRDFMASVDDLTFVRKTKQGLRAGGRKLAAQKRRSIGIEEVATLWQSDVNSRARSDAFAAQAKKRLQALIDRYDAMNHPGSDTASLKAQFDGEAKDLEKQLQREYNAQHIVQGSGFSLDPVVDFDALRRKFTTFSTMIDTKGKPALSTEDNLRAVDDALAKHDIEPYLRMTTALIHSPDREDVGHQLREMRVASSYQAARYDGDMQGTEVGMNLFYTDLLAKLWVIDYARSSPRHTAIVDFVDDPHAMPALVYAKETVELSSARLWFGPANPGYQVAEDGATMLFARTATRLYSAGSNPETPGREVQTSAFLAAATEWWNDHYEEVGDYEPEYQRLNEIMKWSTVVAWLNSDAVTNRLDYLNSVAVDRSNVFPAWVARHADLRFTRWDQIGFRKTGFADTTTESLPLLRGPVTEGGVSLATRDAATRPVLANDVDSFLRRSNIKYSLDANALKAEGKVTLHTLDETTFTLETVNRNRFLVRTKAKDGTLLRSPSTQLNNAEFESAVSTRPTEVRIASRVADAPLADLTIERKPNGFTIGLEARRIDRASALARDLSLADDPMARLAANPTVKTVIAKEGSDALFVRFEDADGWMEFAPEAGPRVEIDPQWQLRGSASMNEAARVIQARTIQDQQMLASLGNQGHLAIQTTPNGGTMLVWVPDKPVPSDALALRTRFGDMQVWPDKDTGWVHLRGTTKPEDALEVAQSMQKSDLDAIRTAKTGPGAPPLDLPGVSGNRTLFLSELEKGDAIAAARRIADDPAATRRAMDASVTKAVTRADEIANKLGPDDALHYLATLRRTYGDQPEISMRESLLYLERGNTDAAVEAAGRFSPRGMIDRHAFYDEVAARIHLAVNPDAGMLRLAEYVEYQRRLGQNGNAVISGIAPRIDGGQFDFGAMLRDMPSSQPALATTDFSNADKAIVYRQSSHPLDTVDWNQPIDTALSSVVQGHLGKIVSLPDSDISQFRPSVIWTPGHAVELKPVKAKVPGVHTAIAGTRTCDAAANDPSCSPDDASRAPRPRRVLLVVAN